MGLHDSSRTRVTPVFDALLARDPTGQLWLPTLLSLPERPGITHAPDPIATRLLIDWAWGKRERALPPPRSLLRWLVTEAALPPDAIAKSKGATREKREALNRRHPTTVAEALTLLGQRTLPTQAWYILEGASKPDVYLATSELLVVIEGKRTEPAPTLDTEWMPVRHQMLRHLDAAWEQLQAGQRLAGFFIVESEEGAAGHSIPQRWREAAGTTLLPEVLVGSLPHRTPIERQRIAAAFLGVTTWQRICAALNLNYTALPDT